MIDSWFLLDCCSYAKKQVEEEQEREVQLEGGKKVSTNSCADEFLLLPRDEIGIPTGISRRRNKSLFTNDDS